MVENSLAAKADKNMIISTARQTAQFSEDARALAVQRQEEERIAKEREDAAAKAKTEAEDKAAVEALRPSANPMPKLSARLSYPQPRKSFAGPGTSCEG